MGDVNNTILELVVTVKCHKKSNINNKQIRYSKRKCRALVISCQNKSHLESSSSGKRKFLQINLKKLQLINIRNGKI